MSRQQGRRSTPKPQRDAYRRSLQTRRSRPLVPAAEPGEPISRGRRWAAVGVATFMLLFAFSGFVAAVNATDAGNDAEARTAMIMASLLALASVAALGSISRAPNPFRRALLAAPLSLSGFIILTYLLDDPSTAVVLSFGIGGAFVLRRDRGHSVGRRITVALFMSLVVYAAYQWLSSEAVLLVAPLLPFVASAVADLAAERMVAED
jgi:hypothetical protein